MAILTAPLILMMCMIHGLIYATDAKRVSATGAGGSVTHEPMPPTEPLSRTTVASPIATASASGW